MPRTARASRFPRGAAVALATLIVLPAPGALGGSEQTISFGYRAGATTWVVPAGVHTATFDLAGARGGIGVFQSQAGRGARVVATIAVTPGETLQINVGGEGGGYLSWPTRAEAGRGKGGWNGGGDGGLGPGDDNGPYQAPGGGGASDVRRDADGDYVLADRILTAGGGGGNSFHTGHTASPVRGLGGDGGGLQGDDGVVGRSGGSGACYLDKAGRHQRGRPRPGRRSRVGGWRVRSDRRNRRAGGGCPRRWGRQLRGLERGEGQGRRWRRLLRVRGAGRGRWWRRWPLRWWWRRRRVPGQRRWGRRRREQLRAPRGGVHGRVQRCVGVREDRRSRPATLRRSRGSPMHVSALVRRARSPAMTSTTPPGRRSRRRDSAARGRTITFGVSMQNDGDTAQKLSLKAMGSATARLRREVSERVRGHHRRRRGRDLPDTHPRARATDLIDDPGHRQAVGATGSKVVRTLAVASGPSPSQKDVVKVTGKRS